MEDVSSKKTDHNTLREKMAETMENLLKDVPVPRFFKATLHFDHTEMPRDKIPEVIFKQLSNDQFASKTKHGMRIAITAKARIVRIPNSLHIGKIMLSEAYWDTVNNISGLEIRSEPRELSFDSDGNLTDLRGYSHNQEKGYDL